MSSVHHALARTLGTAFGGRAAAVEAWMGASSLALGALETSVRGGEGPMTCGRMMIERVPPGAATGFFDAMAVAMPERARSLAAQAAVLGLPTITGWDATTAAVKLYVNASDASRDVRARLGSALGDDAAPHVIGINVVGDQVEEKTYAQSATAPADLDGVAARIAPLRTHDAVGGWVVSRTRTKEGARLRAVFASLKAGHPGARELALGLPGWTNTELDGVTPFPMGDVRSIGFDVARPDDRP
jgi:hypothetical protein